MYILEHFDSYDPISDAGGRSQGPGLSTELPQAVKDFLDLHAQRKYRFFAGKRIGPDSTFPAPSTDNASGERPATDDIPNASLHWFLDTASTLCEVKPNILAREILCVESLLGLYPTDKLDAQAENKDIALTSYFDFIPPN